MRLHNGILHRLSHEDAVHGEFVVKVDTLLVRSRDRKGAQETEKGLPKKALFVRNMETILGRPGLAKAWLCLFRKRGPGEVSRFSEHIVS